MEICYKYSPGTEVILFVYALVQTEINWVGVVRALQVVLPTLGLAWQAIQAGIEELVIAALKWDDGK